MSFIYVTRSYGISMERDVLVNAEQITMIEHTPGGCFIYLLGCKPKNRIFVLHDPEEVMAKIRDA